MVITPALVEPYFGNMRARDIDNLVGLFADAMRRTANFFHLDTADRILHLSIHKRGEP